MEENEKITIFTLRKNQSSMPRILPRKSLSFRNRSKRSHFLIKALLGITTIGILSWGIYQHITNSRLKEIKLLERVEETLKKTEVPLNQIIGEKINFNPNYRIAFSDVGIPYRLPEFSEEMPQELAQATPKPSLTSILNEFEKIANLTEPVDSIIKIANQEYPILHLDLDRDHKLRNIIYVGNNQYIIDSQTFKNLKGLYKRTNKLDKLRVGNEEIDYAKSKFVVLDSAMIAEIAVNCGLDGVSIGKTNIPIGDKEETIRAFDLFLKEGKVITSPDFKKGLYQRVRDLSQSSQVLTYK